jgi:hypothetical protein
VVPSWTPSVSRTLVARFKLAAARFELVVARFKLARHLASKALASHSPAGINLPSKRIEGSGLRVCLFQKVGRCRLCASACWRRNSELARCIVLSALNWID